MAQDDVRLALLHSFMLGHALGAHTANYGPNDIAAPAGFKLAPPPRFSTPRLNKPRAVPPTRRIGTLDGTGYNHGNDTASRGQRAPLRIQRPARNTLS